MIADLKPYPLMKDSGLEWLGEVPEHWKIRRGKSLFSQSSLPVRDEDEIVTCFRDGQVTLRKNRRVSGFMVALHEAGYQGVRAGQLVIHAMDAFAGAIGISDCDGKCTPEYMVLNPRSGLVIAGYFSQLLRHAARQKFILVECPAVRERAPRFRYPSFGSMWMPMPAASEQAAIIRFLDHADRKIRRYIRAKQQLIKLLEEQVSARASGAMRHPACTFERLEHLVTQQIRPIERTEDQPYTALGLYNRGRGIFHKPSVFASELGDSSFSWVAPGDLVISGQFAWEGAVAIASSSEAQTIVSHRYYLLRERKDRMTTAYLWALLRSDFGAMILDQHSRGAAGRNRPLNIRTLLKEVVPVPPFYMQIAVDSLLEESAPVRAQAACAIRLCQEYRIRLIADVATGKLDVREAASRLPDDDHELPAIDELADILDTEEDAPDDLDETPEDPVP
jgi:type I restriction enzyme S subunit